MMLKNHISKLLAVLILFSGCSVEDGVDGIDGFSIGLQTVTQEDGCKELTFFKDSNSNGNFDTGESVIDSFIVCNGVDGVDGADGSSVGIIINTNDSGCNELVFFIDKNSNNIQEEGEGTLSSMSLCNGSDGESYVFVFSDAEDCTNGGITVSIYEDNDKDGEYSTGDTLFQTTSHCFSNTTNASNFYLDDNGVTVRCPNAKIGNRGVIGEKEYIAVDNELLLILFHTGYDPSCLCTSNVTSLYDFYNVTYWAGKNSGNDFSFSWAYREDDTYSIENWDTSKVLNFSKFLYNRDASPNISLWDVSSGTNFSQMFAFADSFNQDISNWDVSNGVNFGRMFTGNDSFNQNIGNWDVSNGLIFDYMFANANSFNQDIGNWNTSNATTMQGMFYGATVFNQAIGNWDTSKVITMSSMFFGASTFNQDIGDWNTSKVITMYSMFSGASSFNQDLSSWNVSNVTDYTDFDTGADSWVLPKPIFPN